MKKPQFQRPKTTPKPSDEAAEAETPPTRFEIVRYKGGPPPMMLCRGPNHLPRKPVPDLLRESLVGHHLLSQGVEHKAKKEPTSPDSTATDEVSGSRRFQLVALMTKLATTDMVKYRQWLRFLEAHDYDLRPEQYVAIHPDCCVLSRLQAV